MLRSLVGSEMCIRDRKYIIHLFDADKQPLTYKNGKIEVDKMETDICDHYLYKYLRYVNVQAIWKDNNGPQLDNKQSVKFSKGNLILNGFHEKREKLLVVGQK